MGRAPRRHRHTFPQGKPPNAVRPQRPRRFCSAPSVHLLFTLISQSRSISAACRSFGKSSASNASAGSPFGEEGCSIDRGTTCRWLRELGSILGASVVAAMRDEAMRTAMCIATDATGVLVQPIRTHEKTRQACKKGHYFVQIADRDHVFFEYTNKAVSLVRLAAKKQQRARTLPRLLGLRASRRQERLRHSLS